MKGLGGQKMGERHSNRLKNTIHGGATSGKPNVTRCDTELRGKDRDEEFKEGQDGIVGTGQRRLQENG